MAEEVAIRGKTFINFPGLNGLTLVPPGLECVLIGGVLVAKSCLTLANPWTGALQVPLSMRFSSKNTRVGCHFLLQEGSNLCLLDWQADSLPLSHQRIHLFSMREFKVLCHSLPQIFRPLMWIRKIIARISVLELSFANLELPPCIEYERVPFYFLGALNEAETKVKDLNCLIWMEY